MGRIDKINQQIKREVSLIIQHDLEDSRLEFVSILSADVSKDLKNARIYFSVLGDQERVKKAQECLDRASNYIRRLLAQRIEIRCLPELHFKYDQTIAYIARIDEKIKEISGELEKNPTSDQRK